VQVARPEPDMLAQQMKASARDFSTRILENDPENFPGQHSSNYSIDPEALDDIGNNNERELSHIIEDMIAQYERVEGRYATQKLAKDIIMYFVKQSDDYKKDPAEFYEKARKHELDERFYEEIQSGLILRKTNSRILFPILSGTHLNSPVSKYESISGIKGETVVRVLLKTIIRPLVDETEAEAFRRVFDNTIYTTAVGNLSPPQITNASKEENRTQLLKVSQSIPDDRNSLIKAFPTFRLYLIDFRGPRIAIRDNFYGYNAIESIDITLDKNDAGLAVVRLADPLHILQGDFLNVDPDSENIVDDVILKTSDLDTISGHVLSRFILSQGRSIMIKAGYSSDPENLDTIFTGRIAEIQFGDIVTIVAQDWKSEIITKEVEFEAHANKDRSVKDLVVGAIRRANPNGFGEIFSFQELEAIRKLAPIIIQFQTTSRKFMSSYVVTYFH